MHRIMEDKARPTEAGKVCSGSSGAETHFEAASDGLLKLSGCADFEPTGEELWRRRIRLLPKASECCPWATFDDGTLKCAFGGYTWVADGSEAADSVDASSQYGGSRDIGTPPLETPSEELVDDVDGEEARKLRDYTAFWVEKLRALIDEELARQ